MSHRQETLVGFSGWIVIGKGKKEEMEETEQEALV